MHLKGSKIFGKSLACDYFPLVTLCIYSFREFFVGDVFVLLGTVLVLPFFIHLCRCRFYRNQHAIIFLLLTLLGGVLNMFFTPNGPGGLFVLFSTFVLAFFCCENPRITLWFSLLYLFFLFYFLYKKIFIESADLNTIYEAIGLSKNYPGYLLVAFSSYYGYMKYRLYHTLPFLIFVPCILLAYFLDGRSSLGILIGLLIFCVFFYSNKIISRVLLILVLSLIVCSFWDDITTLFSLTNLSKSGLESSRSIIWKSYFEHCSFPDWILGPDTNQIPVVREYGGNPHNAFLNFHRRMGMIGFLSLLTIIVSAIYRYMSEHSFIFAAMLLFYLARIFFDSCSVSTLDYILYSLSFYPFMKYPYHIKRREYLKSWEQRLLKLI